MAAVVLVLSLGVASAFGAVSPSRIKFVYDAAGFLVGVYNLNTDVNNCGSVGRSCDGDQPCCVDGVCGHLSGTFCVSQPTVSVSVTPNSAILTVGKTQQFAATVQNATDTTVTWKVNGITNGDATVGTIDATGFYTAPTSVESATTFIVSAVSHADPTRSATASVIVVGASEVYVAVTPSPAVVPMGTTRQFTATVLNAEDTSVTWDSSRVDANGLYTAPSWISIPAGDDACAVSNADLTKRGCASVIVVPSEPSDFSVTPAFVTNSSTSWWNDFYALSGAGLVYGATWLVNGIVGGDETVGTISSDGQYSSPAVRPNPPFVTITAVDGLDPLRWASATVWFWDPPPVTVYIAPTSPTVIAGQSIQFKSKVYATEYQVNTVSWQVNGILNGTTELGRITTGGLYTAPSVVPSVPIEISANPEENGGLEAKTPVTIVPSAPVVTLPTSATVPVGTTQQFQAIVLSSSNRTVTWSVNDIAGGDTTVGTINSSGLYTAPAAVPAPETVTVKATLNADPTKFATSAVKISSSWPVTVSVSCPALTPIGVAAPCSASVGHSIDTSVTWYVNRIAGGDSTNGTISPGGYYLPPSRIPGGGTVDVTAVPNADPETSASAPVTVTPSPPVMVSVEANGYLMRPYYFYQTYTGLSVSFQATVRNTADTSVTWMVNGVPGGNARVGTIDASGRYVAPAAAPLPYVYVMAVSNADPNMVFPAELIIMQ